MIENPRLQSCRLDRDSVAIGDGKLIYLLIAKREEFDRIALPVTDHGENDRGHVITKSVNTDGVYIVFQHWLKELTIEAIREDNERRRSAAADIEPCGRYVK